MCVPPVVRIIRVDVHVALATVDIEHGIPETGIR